MPKVNTFNYDTIVSWNGAQDLFVIEQPDGTKVATPAMVKQFIEAGDFTATGEIEDGHGNKLKDMAKASVVDAKIGDLSQTGLTGNSVAAQLTTAEGQINHINPDANTLKASLLQLEGPNDITMVFKETGTDDYKKIQFLDANGTERYYLLFAAGHLRFASKDANGNTIVNTQLA